MSTTVSTAASTPLVAPWAVTTLVLAAVVGVAGALAAARWRRAPLWLVLLVALAVRVVVVRLSYGHTPGDIGVATKVITDTIHQHRDPLTVLPRYRWNFLPFMPTLYALLDHLGLAWQYTVKVPAVAADLVSTVLVGHLVGTSRRRAAQWLFATSPVAVLVAGVHGQVEPTAIALILGAYLLVRRLPVGGGVLVGAAVAAKTWPLITGPGLLARVSPRRWWQVVVGAVVVPVLTLLEGLLLLHDHLGDVVSRLVGYRSYVGTWGWTGLLHLAGRAGTGYVGPDVDRWQRLGSALLAFAAVAVVAVLRRRGGVSISLGLILAFYVVTAGFGPQYLMWCLPFAIAQDGRAGVAARRILLPLAAAYCGLLYGYVLPLGADHSAALGLDWAVWASVPVVAAAAVCLAVLLTDRRPAVDR